MYHFFLLNDTSKTQKGMLVLKIIRENHTTEKIKNSIFCADKSLVGYKFKMRSHLWTIKTDPTEFKGTFIFSATCDSNNALITMSIEDLEQETLW